MRRLAPGFSVLIGLSVLLLSLMPAPGSAQRRKASQQRWEKMDYGPFLSATITAPYPSANTANKGVAIHLGKDAAVCFDTDLVRYSAAWTGEFLNLKGTPYDGSHGPHPTVKGTEVFGTARMPGWSKPGSKEDFADPRPEPYGTLPRSWARYRGLYLSGDKVLLSYTVGDCSVLDLPGVQKKGDLVAFTRTLNMSPSKEPLLHVIAEAPGHQMPRLERGNLAAFATEKDVLVVAGLVNPPAGATWVFREGRVLLSLPAHKEASKFQIVMGSVKKSDLGKFSDFLGKAGDLNLAKLTTGGPARWKEDITTKGKLGADTGAYVVDTIEVPEANPYNSWMRCSGLDFFSDGRAALCTWSGDVWVVSGLDGKLEKVTWKRFATGLFQPLGLKIVGDQVYTLGREGIVRLHDLNGDGEADFYQAFNNDVATTPGFHEFAFDLHTDPEGNFYYSKAGPVRGGGRGFEYISAHAGCIMKVSKDGSKHEVFATGFRAPNGIGVGPHGEVTSGDNEGTWMPQCRLSLVKPGSFNGCVDTAHRSTPPTDYDRPICWFPKHVDNSSGGQVWVTSDKWGPLKDRLLHMSYGQSSLYLVLLDQSGKEVQGGVVRMPVKFQSGVMRARINPKDGQLYVTGLRGWQTNAARDADFERVRYTGKPLNMVTGLEVVKGGLKLTFSDKLDPKSVDADGFAIEQWNYLWCSEYGSRDYKVTPNFHEKVLEYNRLRLDRRKNAGALQKLSKEFIPGKDKVDVKSAALQADGKTVLLQIPSLQPVMQMRIQLRVKTADGKPLSQEIYNTINLP